MDLQGNRGKVIVRTSIIGILANVFLAAFKALVGLTAHSIAIIMDAVNNLSDAASSVITIVGTKLAGKEPDKEHPFGYGRVEYLSAMVISVLVLYAGITAFVESVKKIIHPDTPDYNTITLVIVVVAVVVKIVLGRYVKGVGEKVNSDSLINSGEDATLDSIISASTLVAAVVYLVSGISVEAWLGAIIAAVIIKSGFEMLRETMSKILGEHADAQLVRDIKETLTSYPEVYGAYDLVLNNYGPDTYNGSVHLEVPDTMTAAEIDPLMRKITIDVLHKHRVALAGISIYSFNQSDPDVVAARNRVAQIVADYPHILQMHGFYLDKVEHMMRFDIVVSFDAKDRKQVYREVCDRVKDEFPDYIIHVAMDNDFSGEEA